MREPSETWGARESTLLCSEGKEAEHQGSSYDVARAACEQGVILTLARCARGSAMSQHVERREGEQLNSLR